MEAAKEKKQEFGLGAIGQIAIVVHDVERARDFYRDALGMELLFEAPGMAFFDAGGVRLMLSLPESEELDHPSSILYFRVGDIEGAHQVLRERGVPFERAPERVHKAQDHELWIAFFRDSEENLLALMSERSVG